MKVFISHAYTDEALAKRVAAGLKDVGLEVWDESEVLPGENWAARVGEALQNSEAMVVLLTPDGLRSSQVRREIDYALSRKDYSDRLIPVLAWPQDEMPQDDIPWILRRLKMIELPRGQDKEGIKQIAQALMATA
jgi:hypothetical protein